MKIKIVQILLVVWVMFLGPEGVFWAPALSHAAQSTPDAAGIIQDGFREITDMAGRRVKIPKTVNKVLSTSPPPATFVYMLAPEKLGGWFFKATREASKFIPEQYRNIKILGWGRKASNYEAYIAQRPDVVFVGYEMETDPTRIDLIQEKFGRIPVVCVDNTRNAVGYGDTILFMGYVLGVPARAQVLVDYYNEVLAEVQQKTAAIPGKDRVRVYYAEGANGLATDPAGSFHSQLIEVCGGINVADCKLSSGSGMTGVTMESVLMWRPEKIITTSPEFVRHAYGDSSWKRTYPVQHQLIYCAPQAPFNWFDRPPGVNRIAGIPWTAHILYPELFSQAWFQSKIKTFFSLYYHYDLSDEDLSAFTQDRALNLSLGEEI